MKGDPQQEIIDFLVNPATFGSTEIARIDTHISRIFLAGDRAYKLKRAVALPYLDFSTPEKRRRACFAELEVNALYGGDLYVGMKEILRRSDGSLSLGDAAQADETAIEWLIEMRRFPSDAQLDRLSARGTLDWPIMAALTDRIVAAHERSAPDAGFGTARHLRDAAIATADTLRQVRQAVDHDSLARWLCGIDAALQRRGDLIEFRRRTGKVRACHGDLHLRNICLVDGAPLPFDALEFDPALSTIDVLYDLSFLLMDLLCRGHGGLANATLNRYLDRCDEVDGLPLLPLLLSLRAAIRAQAEAAGAAQEGAEPCAPGLFTAVRDYMKAALTFLAPPKPRLIAIGGFSGSGKSTLAREIAPEIGPAPGARILRSDVMRKRLAGIDERERLPPESYTVESSRKVYAALIAESRRVLRSGHAVILDSVASRQEERDDMAALANDLGIPFTGIWLVATPTIMKSRIERRSDDASDATPGVLDRQIEAGAGGIGWVHIGSGGSRDMTRAAALDAIRSDLDRHS